MAEYHKQSVEVIIDKESELYKRICAVAENRGYSVEHVFETIAQVGLAHHMGRNLKYMYEGSEQK